MPATHFVKPADQFQQLVGAGIEVGCHLSDVIDAFRTKAEEVGRGYQTLINDALRQYLSNTGKPVDTKTLRRILREELNKPS